MRRWCRGGENPLSPLEGLARACTQVEYPCLRRLSCSPSRNWVLTCGPGDPATSPEAPCSYLHENEFGAQGGHVWELFSEAQHDPAVWQPALVAIKLLQLWRDTRWGRGGWRLGALPPSSPSGLLRAHTSAHTSPRLPFQGPFSRRPPGVLTPGGRRGVTLAPSRCYYRKRSREFGGNREGGRAQHCRWPD